MPAHPETVLFKNGFIVDGTGAPGRAGSLKISKGIIESVITKDTPDPGCRVIDCEGRVVAPGFIDMHSHNDWFLFRPDHGVFTAPFAEQGITTFVGGNCGFAAAGFQKQSPFTRLIEDNMFQTRPGMLKWDTFDHYFDILESQGLSHNQACLAGHGTTRTSVRGWEASPLTAGEERQMHYLLEEAMDQGAKGVSLGLQYAPGLFSSPDEIEKIAALVKRKDKILTVHPKACSAISGTYPLKPFGKPHNLIAMEEMLNIARKTGVRLQLSHLIFVGRRSWKTLDRALGLIEKARASGLDVMFDTYAHHCGASVITVLLPDWFMAKAPDSFTDRTLVRRIRLLAAVSFKLLGFDFRDIQIAFANKDTLSRYNGMFLSDIARQRGVKPFENYMDFVRKSNGTTRVLMHKYSSPAIVETLMRHPAALFMTDAWIEPEGLQNSAAYGCFPRLLQISRQKGIMPLEQVIHKMTGACAARFRIRDRGEIREGYAADIVVFDRETIADTTTVDHTSRRPAGIHAVFINGVQVVKDGRADPSMRPGRVIR
jgi:N-acyl-D-amino-acid deacylase